MLDSMSVANAKGSILWLIGEYCDKVPKIAPDVLRKAAKAFTQEVILREQIISFVGLWDRLVARARGSKSKGLSSSLSHTEAEWEWSHVLLRSYHSQQASGLGCQVTEQNNE